MKEPLLEWPAVGVTRSPYRVMSDPEIYAQEQQRIFRGPTWNYLCLEAEIPHPGTFRTAFIGETPVIVTRDKEGGIHAMVNRCAHKGAMLCVDPCGKRDTLVCPYHGWAYDLQGKLRGVPFQHGVAGKGGMPDGFDLTQHNLERVHVQSFYGLIFGTFSTTAEPLQTYLGPAMIDHISRVFHKPIEVLGYHHQVLHNNWKLYMENSRDPYHATILHTFYATFKLNRLTMDGGILVDHDGWHSINYSKGATLREGGGEYESGIRSVVEDVGLADPSLIHRKQEFDDGITVAIQSLFPSCVNQQIYNTLALRNVVPQGPLQCELHWTFFGYRDDTPELREMRLKQSNLIGPAGYVSIDDGVIGEYVQRGIAGTGIDASAVMEMGGHEVASTPGSRATEATLRGFWTGYRALMGL
ncbi:MAG TPA: Rieske 2Fe-2S domain-containing protein [Bryobacteraceae bacterium]|jgi:phenylpropionate dioxygenase-like ring-hydroxylating dioxygenase large terminal subunit